MLLVTGGNGNLARSVIANLLRMTDPGNILVTTRNPASPSARELAARGVTVRHGDFDAPETLGPAFAGASRALLISTYADNSERLRQNLAALEAAKAAGVSHILYTSFLSAGPCGYVCGRVGTHLAKNLWRGYSDRRRWRAGAS